MTQKETRINELLNNSSQVTVQDLDTLRKSIVTELCLRKGVIIELFCHIIVLLLYFICHTIILHIWIRESFKSNKWTRKW